MAKIKGEYVNNRELYIELMKSSNDFINVTKSLFVTARLDNNIDDYDFLEIKKVYFALEKQATAKRVGSIAL